MADQEVKKHPDLDLLHQQLLKDQYAVPEDYTIFEKTFKDPINAKALYDQLAQDNYAVPSDYNEFLYTFGLKKKEAGDYGLPSSKVFKDMFAQVRKGKVTESQPEEGLNDTVSKPETDETDLLSAPKEKENFTGENIFKSTLQFSIGDYLTKERFDHLKKPKLSLEEPKEGFKEKPIGQQIISEELGKDYFKTKTEAELVEIDKKLAALPEEDKQIGTILPTAGPYISKPIISEERAKLLKEKDQLNMLLKTPSKLTYILGRAYNQTITGLADNIINGEARAPEEWLNKYDSDTMTDVTAMVLGFLLDMPAFGMGGKIGTAITKKAAAPFVKRVMENSAKKMIKVGIPEKLAGEFALKAAERTTMALQGMGSSSAALGTYSAVTDALGQWAVPDAIFDDIKWSQVFKHGMESSVLGLGVGGLGIGASMLAQKASAIPGAVGRLGAKAAIGTGGLTAESALFTYGGAMLEGRGLKDVTEEDFLSTVAMLGMLKATHVVGKIPGAIEDPKKAAASFYKSVAYNQNKVGEGIFAVDLVPYEIESVGGKDYKSLVRKLAHDDAYLGTILQNENIPARLKQKLLWASRGTAMEDVNLYGDKITQNGVYVDMTNKEGVLVERKKFGTPEEAESFAIRNQAQLNDIKIQEKAASLPIEEKTKIIEKLKEEGFDDALLVSALEKPVGERTPEENKLVSKYYSFVPKGDIKPEDVIKEEIPDVIVVEPGKEVVIEKPEVKEEKKPEEVVEKSEKPVEKKPVAPKEIKPDILKKEKKSIERWLKDEGEEFISVDWDGEIVEIFKGRDERVQEYTRDELIEKGVIFPEEKPVKPKKPEAPEKPVIDLTPKKKKPRFKEGSSTWKAVNATPSTFEESLGQYLLSGGALSAKDYMDITGFPANSKEIKILRLQGIIKNDGAKFDTFHEQFSEEDMFKFKGGGDTMDMPNAISEFLRKYNTRSKILNELLRRIEEPGKQEFTEDDIARDLEKDATPEEFDKVAPQVVDEVAKLFDSPEISQIFKSERYIKEDGSIDWDGLKKLAETNPEHFTDFPYNLNEKEFETFKNLINDKEKQSTIEKLSGKVSSTESAGEGSAIPGGVPEVPGRVEGEGKAGPEEKPVKPEIKATPEQQAQIDKINKEYDERIAKKQEELDDIPNKIEKAVGEANKRAGLFGDLKPVEKDEIIKREEQGFNLEGAVERIRKPFEERAAELRKEIDALARERESKIGEVLRQQDLFAAAPAEPTVESLNERAKKFGITGRDEGADIATKILRWEEEFKPDVERIVKEFGAEAWEKLKADAFKIRQGQLGNAPEAKTPEPKEEKPEFAPGKTVKEYLEVGDFMQDYINQVNPKYNIYSMLDLTKGGADKIKSDIERGRYTFEELKDFYNAGKASGLAQFQDPVIDRLLEYVRPKSAETKPEVPKEAPKIEDEFFDIRPEAEDIPFETARRAHMFTSFDPDKRGRSEQKEYTDHINSVIDEMSKLAINPDQKVTLKSEIQRYKEGYIKKFKAYLDAASRTASSMITGPSNFPVERNRKALAAADNRMKELIDWDEKAQKAIRKALKGAQTPEEYQSEKWGSIKKNIDDNLATIIGIDKGEVKGYNRALFVSSLKGFIERMANNGQVEDVRMAIDYIKKVQEGLKKPIFSERNEIWNAVSNAEFYAKRAVEKKQKGEVVVKEYDGAKVVNNYEAERVQITMDEKPSADVISALKKQGWKWSPSNSAWQRQSTGNAVRSAESIMDKYFKAKAEKAPEGAKEYKYRLTLRPFDIGTYPKEGFVKAELEPGERFETLTYNKKLTAQERGHYDLLPLTEISDIKGKLFEDRDGEFFVDLEWKANNSGADVSSFDNKNQLIEKPFFMSTKDILENIEKGYWKEKPETPPSKPEGLPQRKEGLGTKASKVRKWQDKNKRAGNKIITETKEDAEAIGFADQLPLSTKEDPAYASSDLNNSMTLSQISRNLISNLKRKPGGGVRSGMIKRFMKRAAGVFFPDSGIVRIKGLKDFRVLSHELGHWIDFQIFDFRNVVGAKNLPDKYAEVAKEIRSVGVKYKGRVYRDFDKIDRDAREIDKKTNLPRLSAIKANELKITLQPQLNAREQRLVQLRAKYGDDIVAGVLQRDYFQKELADFLIDIGYPMSARSKTEAIAEFVYNYIADPKTAENNLPKFHAWFEKMLDAAPPIKEALTIARKEFKDYADLDPRARRYIENEKKDTWFEGLIKSWDPDKFLYSYVNHLQYMRNLSEEWKLIVGSNAVMFKDPYASAKAMMGIDGRAQQWLLYHPYFKRGNDIEIKTDIEGLVSVLKPIIGTKKYGDYSDYLLAKDSLESYQNRKPEQAVMPIDDARAKIDLYEKQYGVRDLWDFQSKVQKYNEALLDFYAESGKISREVIERIKKEHQYYVPLRRVFEEFEKSKGMAGTGKDVLATSEKGIWKRLGSQRQVRDIFSSMIENTYNILSASEHNIHNRNVRDALFDIQNYSLKESKGDKFLLKEDKSLIQLIENNNVIKPAFDVKTGEMTWVMTHQAPKGKILSVWEEGKIKYYDVDAETYNNLFQNEPKVSHLIRVLSMPSRWLQAGAVVWDPTFPIRNVGRDQISAWFYSKYGYSPSDFVRGISSYVKKDDFYQKWMASGADQSFLVSMDRLLEKNNVERKIGRTLERKWKTYSKNPLLALQDFSRMSEIGTRVGAFKNAYKKTKDVYAAALESRDISADYGVHGAAMRSILPLYPFLNARLQHTRMMVEAAGRDPKKFFLKGLAITAPAIMNWLANNWDEEATARYQSLPEWRRIGMFNIRIPGTDNYLPLPKGFLGMLFASSVESALDFAAKEDPRAAKALAREMFKDFSPISNVSEFIPFAIRPKVEMVMNKKAYTNKPIIPETLAMLKPEEQYFESTPEIFKKIGEITGVSPLKMDHYVKSYFGGAGIGAVRIVDEILQGLGLVESKPDDLFTTLSRMPLTKAFMTETPIGPYSSYVSDFYTKLDEMEKLNRSFNNHVMKEDYERLEKLMDNPDNEDLFTYYEGNKTAINKFRATMSGIRDLKIANLRNDMMTNVEARKENDRLDQVIHETAIRFRDSWEKFKDGKDDAYFDFDAELDDVIKNLKVDKSEVKESLKQQKLIYNPYWLMLREKDEKVWGLLKEFGGFKEIEQTRSISKGTEKIDLSLQETRIFNERLTEEYGKAVKSLIGTDPRSYKSKSENMQPGMDKTQLEHLYGVAWQQAMDKVRSSYMMGNFKSK